MAEARRLFALDQNFPTPIVDVLVQYQVRAELVPIRDIDARMMTLEDWEVLLALHHHERPWDGLITTDSSMLRQARELAALIQTKLTLVVPEDAGHNPVKAAGLLFTHLENVCKRTSPTTAQVWTLRAAAKPSADPWKAHLATMADHRGVTAADLYAANKLAAGELATDPLAP